MANMKNAEKRILVNAKKEVINNQYAATMKNSIKRTLKKTQRTLVYFYEEHRYICNIIFIILSGIIFIRTYYYFGVSHKVLKEKQL